MAITLRAARAADLDATDSLYRLAFGTHFGLADPRGFNAGSEPVRVRWGIDAERVLLAEDGATLVGFVIATRWGSLGLFGPLGVDPAHQGRGIARRLVEGAIAHIEAWSCPHRALYTNLVSPKTVALYQKYDYWPQRLSMMMARPVVPTSADARTRLFSRLDGRARARALDHCRALAETGLAGLDLGMEIEGVVRLGVGDTVLLDDEAGLAGFAVCHCGPGSEGGHGRCVIKFAMVRSDAQAPQAFARLLDGCAALARTHGLERLLASVNSVRTDAYRCLLELGFVTQVQGVSMHWRNAPLYDRADAYLVDDWR